MPDLFLLRHAKSSWDDPKLPDHSRPLNARGRNAAQAVGRVMRGLEIVPDLILVSSARRTLQTLELLEAWNPAPRIEIVDGLYLAAGRVMLDFIHQVPDETQRLLVIGHNPGLHELALMLTSNDTSEEEHKMAEGFPTGALAWFQTKNGWADLRERKATLNRFIAPGDLAEPGL